jgi:hypothetical protein
VVIFREVAPTSDPIQDPIRAAAGSHHCPLACHRVVPNHMHDSTYFHRPCQSRNINEALGGDSTQVLPSTIDWYWSIKNLKKSDDHIRNRDPQACINLDPNGLDDPCIVCPRTWSVWIFRYTHLSTLRKVSLLLADIEMPNLMPENNRVST